MHRLAMVTSEEGPAMTTQKIRVSIIPDDVGDEDCRKITFDVFAGALLLQTFPSQEEAFHFCLDNNMEVV